MSAQRCPFIDVVAQYCNNCSDCAHDVTIAIDFSSYPNNAAGTVCGYTTATTALYKQAMFNLGGSWPTFTANLGNVDAGNSVSVGFRLEFDKLQPTNVNAVVTATTATGPVLAGCESTDPPAQATMSKSLYCDDNGETIASC
jgi:hypothetical protein